MAGGGGGADGGAPTGSKMQMVVGSVRIRRGTNLLRKLRLPGNKQGGASIPLAYRGQSLEARDGGGGQRRSAKVSEGQLPATNPQAFVSMLAASSISCSSGSAGSS